MFHRRLKADLAILALVMLGVMLIIVALAQLPWPLALGLLALVDLVLAVRLLRQGRRRSR